MVHNQRLRHRLIVEQIQQRNQDYGYKHIKHGRHAHKDRHFLHYLSAGADGVLGPLSAASDKFSIERRLCLKASATFLSALRTNLCLTAHPTTSSSFLPPSSMSSSIDALPLAPVANDFHPTPEPDVPDTDPDAIPELTFYPTTDDADRTAALKLVADSIAQQRQTASRALLSHPLHIALFVAVCSLLGRWLFLLRGELGVALSTVGGLTMGVLVVIRWAVAPYIELAEGVHPELLEGKEVVIAKYGQEVIGAAVWGWMDEGKKKKGRKAEVVAWTVRLKYRGKGIGVGLLETVVDEVRGKGGEGVGMVEGGIYSKRVLWNVYNGVFERREERAKRALQATWEARAGGNTRRKR